MKFQSFFATILLVVVSFIAAFAQCVAPVGVTAQSVSPTASSPSTTNNNGKIVVFGYTPGQRFQVAIGSPFNINNTTAVISTMPSDGIVEKNIANPTIAQTYTIRIFDATNDNCFTDVTTTMHPTIMAAISALDTFTLQAPDTLANVQWFFNGVAIDGATGSTYLATVPGRYTYTGDMPSGCNMSACSVLELVHPTTLPVKLLYFTGNAKICDVTLRWATATELNAKMFEIYRSIDGVNFTKIATIAAAGTTNTTQYYEFTDNTPYKTSYYRLVEVDFDGASQTFNLAQRITTQNCDSNSNNGISAVYPNPNGTDAVNVRFFSDRDPEAVDFIVYDVLGREMSVTPTTINNGSTVVTLPISDLAAGTYMIKVRGAGWYSVAQKFVRVINQ
jgi:hypothetical protein